MDVLHFYITVIRFTFSTARRSGCVAAGGGAVYRVYSVVPSADGGWCVGFHGRPDDRSVSVCVTGDREAVFTQQVVPQDVCRRRDQGPCEGFKGRWVCFCG